MAAEVEGWSVYIFRRIHSDRYVRNRKVFVQAATQSEALLDLGTRVCEVYKLSLHAVGNATSISGDDRNKLLRRALKKAVELYEEHYSLDIVNKFKPALSNGCYHIGGSIQKSVDSMIHEQITLSLASIQLLTPKNKIYLCVLSSRRVVAAVQPAVLRKHMLQFPPLALDVVYCSEEYITEAMLKYAADIYANLHVNNVTILGVLVARKLHHHPTDALQQHASNNTTYRGGDVVSELFAICDFSGGIGGPSSRSIYRKRLADLLTISDLSSNDYDSKTTNMSILRSRIDGHVKGKRTKKQKLNADLRQYLESCLQSHTSSKTLPVDVPEAAVAMTIASEEIVASLLEKWMRLCDGRHAGENPALLPCSIECIPRVVKAQLGRCCVRAFTNIPQLLLNRLTGLFGFNVKMIQTIAEVVTEMKNDPIQNENGRGQGVVCFGKRKTVEDFPSVGKVSKGEGRKRVKTQ